MTKKAPKSAATKASPKSSAAKRKPLGKPSILRFAAPYAEMVVGHVTPEDFPAPKDPRGRWVALEARAEEWFQQEDPFWHEHDDVFHMQAPMLVKEDSVLLVLDADGEELREVTGLEELLEDGTIKHRGCCVTIPDPAGDSDVGVMAWERFAGVIDFTLLEIEEFETKKLTFEITKCWGMCDVSEDEYELWLVTKVWYGKQLLEQKDNSGRGRGAGVMFRLTPADGELVQPVKDGSLRLDAKEMPD
jgi:hypothetical protein